MGKGLGNVQRAVLDVVRANPDGAAVDVIATKVFGAGASPAQLESVRRSLRTLSTRGLVESSTRWETGARRSRKRLVDLEPCSSGFCHACAQRLRRVRLGEWHHRVMRANAKHDPAWLDDLAVAEASGFVHEYASSERIVDTKPTEVDVWVRPIRFYSPTAASVPSVPER